ncbi:hypothetical protein BCR44DRAFT_1481771 [Catenaria anguillulae PL171]|uniref:Ubiquitin-like modifier-activating enzyme ATG7 n=1 Tax=Catenaria anguillulae PL171 TaxID=765915 RepID=A0A1Y2I568_9FUNG|nr:hypothetical protein BCR44DRAFT_1481771 [Catenaria anguillulae PL171]
MLGRRALVLAQASHPQARNAQARRLACAHLRFTHARPRHHPAIRVGAFDLGSNRTARLAVALGHLARPAHIRLLAPPISTVVPGTLKNTNTIEDFKRLDKAALFNVCAQAVWDDIVSGKALRDPKLLAHFLVVSFADLKKHKFVYWFAFPAITSGLGVTVGKQSSLVEWVGDHDRLQRRKRPATNPSWPARNLLLLLAHHGVKQCTLIAARHDLTADAEKNPGTYPQTAGQVKATGWERTADGKLAPRSVDLAHMMDPKRLAEDAVHLNLKLMKWRVLPSLDLDAISSARCLLLGAGTLGCYVARSLLAWGVKHVTFVDYGKVSFSNPVRQPLFTFEDCLAGGRDKAVAAAERARAILPTLNATGHALSIPMPGHPVLNEAQFQEVMVQLEALFKAHDVVYLLMDSRESRWLPTLLGKVHGKTVINAALGFDSFVVMRHSDELGCYFCNDVVAPTDSLSDRTLDQMCTVTRPGLAAMAGATAVELMASLLNHEHRYSSSHAAPAHAPTPLGPVPHQLRGFLSSHESLLVTGQAYESVDFVREVCNAPGVLEKMTGLDEMKREAEEALKGWEAEGDEDTDDF